MRNQNEDHREYHLKLIHEIRELERAAGSLTEKERARFQDRGQLTPRERLTLLLDEGSSWIELSSLAGFEMHDDRGKPPLGGGMIAGIGWVSGARVLVFIHNSARKSGAISPMGVKKTLRIQEIALTQGLPLITLAESAGAHLKYQSELFVEGGSTFANQARLSARSIPQLTVVHGASTAGGAYIPGLSDQVIMVKERARVYLGGPLLVEAATGEKTSDEELGGAEMHGETTGSAEWVAEDDEEAILMARRWMYQLTRSRPELRGRPVPSEFFPPLNSQEKLLDLVPIDFRRPYDPRELIKIIFDGGIFDEFKPTYGPEMVVGYAECFGLPVGVIANHGPIKPAGAGKAAQWIALACQRGLPLVFLQNTTGFMIGTQAERDGIVKRGAALIQAVTNATVPKITFLIGGSFGAGHYAMCGRPFLPDFIFAWPQQKLAVMGGSQAAQVMTRLAARSGMSQEQLAEIHQQLEAQFEIESSALYATARLWDDGIIDPRDTRRLLAELLVIVSQRRSRLESRDVRLPLGVARN